MGSDHTIRTEVRLSGSIPATFIMGKDLDGIYIGGDFQGIADGFYVENISSPVPDGLWSGGINTGLPSDGLWLGGAFAGVVDGYYVANVRTTLADGLWVGEQYQGAADGWYVSNARETLADGLWVGEVYQGVVDGFYVDNSPTTVPDGYWSGGVLGAVPDGYWEGGVLGPVPDAVWDGGVDTGIAQGWYEANKPALVPSGIWNGGVNEGLAQGYYVSNVKAPIPDGCYRGGGLVDPYYERIRDAALAEGGGLYLFQLEHGQYAGEQVIWQEMGEVTPWVPGLSTPQGKTYDLMGSGEYLGQSVSMRRPVDGVWDGVSSSLVASSGAVGGHLHQYKPSACFAGIDVIAPINNAVIVSTSSTVGPGIQVRQNSDGIVCYRVSDGNKGNQSLPGLGLNTDPRLRVVGAVFTDRLRIFLDSEIAGISGSIAPYPDLPATGLLAVGSYINQTAQNIHARYTYIAIYTREPTPYEISLHTRTP